MNLAHECFVPILLLLLLLFVSFLNKRYDDHDDDDFQRLLLLNFDGRIWCRKERDGVQNYVKISLIINDCPNFQSVNA